MIRGQVLDPITASHIISLSPSTTHSHGIYCMLSPSTPVTAPVVPIPTLLLQGCADWKTRPRRGHILLIRWQSAGDADCGMWLGRLTARANVGSIIIQYNGPGPLSALCDCQTDHSLAVRHAANRAAIVQSSLQLCVLAYI